MQAEYFQATPYKLSVDENDPIHQWRLRSKNLNIQNQAENDKKDLIEKILRENDEKETNIPPTQTVEKSNLIEENSHNQKDFEKFIEKSKSILNNMKTFNETVQKSELSIEILTAKTNLQNKLNELTLNKDFKNQEREKIKEQISELTNLETEIKKKENNSNENHQKNEKNENEHISPGPTYKIEVHAPENKGSHKEIVRKDTYDADSIERESKISLTSFLEHKTGISHVNRIFNLENEKKNERKATDYDYYQEHITETDDGKKIKNSKRLFESKFKQQLEILKFKEKPNVVLTLADQLYQCYSCHKPIKKSFLFFLNTARYCHYSGFWHCVDCISIEKKPIPYKALEEFDLKAYSVSKDSHREMEVLYKKPILLLEYTNPIIKKNKTIYEFLVLRRELHLIYDMICNPILVQDLMQDKINLALKENLFSLQNLLDIYNGSLAKLLNKCLSMLKKHINHCKDCLVKGVMCKLCNDPKKIFIFDINETALCPQCKRLYHKQCLQAKVCIYCVHDA